MAAAQQQVECRAPRFSFDPDWMKVHGLRTSLEGVASLAEEQRSIISAMPDDAELPADTEELVNGFVFVSKSTVAQLDRVIGDLTERERAFFDERRAA